MTNLPRLLNEIAGCTICSAELPHGPRPVVQAAAGARILVAGQAPGRRVHESGIPFDDPSGDRLRDWLGLSRERFYDPGSIAILPMGFCYPGTGASGDLPPRPECAPAWREAVLDRLPAIELTLVLGRYAQAYHMGLTSSERLTDLVRGWKRHWPELLPLPHPSPRNRGWFRRNPWFEEEVVPALRERVRSLFDDGGRGSPETTGARLT